MQYFSLFFTSAADATQTTGNSVLSMVAQFGSLILIFGVLYFLMIRPQKKKEKEAKNMRDNLEIGDEVTTIGGIVGIVVRKSEDTVVIETGGDRSKIRVKTWAIQSNDTVHDTKEA